MTIPGPESSTDSADSSTSSNDTSSTNEPSKKPSAVADGQAEAVSQKNGAEKGQAKTLAPDGPKPTGGKTLDDLKKQQKQLLDQWKKKQGQMLDSGSGMDIWARGMAMLKQVVMNAKDLAQINKGLKDLHKEFKKVKASNTHNKAKHISKKDGVPVSKALHKVLKDDFKKNNGKEPSHTDMKKAMKNFTTNFRNEKGKALSSAQKGALSLKDEDFAQQQRNDSDGEPEFDNKGKPVMEYTGEVDQSPERAYAADCVLEPLNSQRFEDRPEKPADNTNASDNAPKPATGADDINENTAVHNNDAAGEPGLGTNNRETAADTGVERDESPSNAPGI